MFLAILLRLNIHMVLLFIGMYHIVGQDIWGGYVSERIANYIANFISG